MIKKTRHPSNRGERLAVKAKKEKKVDYTSAVFKLLKEKELLDDEASRLPRDRDTSLD